MHPYNLAGAYSNFMMDDEGEARVEATYGENYDRLAAVKGKYDPANLFRVNQNIRPAAIGRMVSAAEAQEAPRLGPKPPVRRRTRLVGSADFEIHGGRTFGTRGRQPRCGAW